MTAAEACQAIFVWCSCFWSSTQAKLSLVGDGLVVSACLCCVWCLVPLGTGAHDSLQDAGGGGEGGGRGASPRDRSGARRSWFTNDVLHDWRGFPPILCVVPGAYYFPCRLSGNYGISRSNQNRYTLVLLGYGVRVKSIGGEVGIGLRFPCVHH
ncbi:hypothetical protein B0T25DRAFT_338024 [Lasiosphaeria hispida]|uniref:Secreted protein n=1 Tax=Lasiosphaeria hispida TaxID=260671 RepID=A0AAJ0H6N5_9PEZI|nr:hypothetical protein B0T25DRAFT_338024 [Lasiosphaeria hispida]